MTCIYCQSCGSKRIIELSVKSPDGTAIFFNGKEYSGITISDIVEGEYTEPRICLDCGQCQGLFPKEFNEEANEFISPPETYKDADLWLKDLKSHDCGKVEFVPADNVMIMAMGFTCIGCSEWFGMKVLDFKKSKTEENTGIMQDLFSTGQNRIDFAKKLNGNKQ